MDNNLRFGDIAIELQVGISEVHCDSLGRVTFVGWSKEGDAVLQDGDNFTTIPEITWNLMDFTVPFEPETHVRYISEDTLKKFHEDDESFLHGTFTLKPNLIYKYEAVINIKKVYDKLE